MQIRKSHRVHAPISLALAAGLAAALPALGAGPCCKSPAPVLAEYEVVETQANVFTSSEQANATLAMDAAGNITLAWDSRRQEEGTYGVYARRFDAAGRPLTPETRINVFARGMQQNPAVATTADGTAWFAWTSFGQDGHGLAVVARRLDASLTDGTGELAVNITREGDQATPVVAANASGDALIVWSNQNWTPEQGSVSRVVARLFGADGAAKTGEIVLGNTTEARDAAPAVSTRPDGSFAVVWSRSDDEGRPVSVMGQIINPDGTPRGGAFALSDNDGAAHIEPSVAALPDGRIAAAWLTPFSDRDGYGVRVRLIDDSGSPLGVPHEIDLPAGASASGVAIAAAADGRTLVTFNLRTPSHEEGDLYAVQFDAQGEPVGGLFRPTAASKGVQSLDVANGATRTAWGPQGQFAIAWYGDAGQGDPTAANLTLLAPPAVLAAAGPAPAPAVAPQAAPQAAEPSHVPPVWDPNWVPQQPATGARGSGPDFGFEAVPGTGWTPPDPEMAVGPNHIVVMVNGQIAYFDKTGGPALFRDEIEGASGFWGAQGAGGFVFDPEVHWDPHAQRFWAMACERTGGQSYFLVAVSDDDNPVGTWHKYRLNVTTLAGADIDSPQIAMDDEALYLAADFFTPNDKFLVYILPKAPLLAGGAATGSRSVLINGTQSYGVPVTFDADAPAQYMIESTEFTTNNSVVFHALRNVLSTPTRVTFSLPVPTYRYPGQPTQQGTSVQPFLFEPRFWSCVQRDGSIWAVHHIRTANGTNTIVRWYEFAMNGWPESGQNPSIRQWGHIDPGPGLHAYFPSITVDGEGNAAITFARSGTSEYIGMWRALRRANDPLGTFRAPALVRASTTPYTGSNRWGDYSGTDDDPAQPCVFWGHHEWTTSQSGWRTWVGRYDNFALADINHDCALTLEDFVTFRNLYVAGSLDADFDGNGVLTLADFVAFRNAYTSGQ